MNAAHAGFSSVEIATIHGPRDMPCENAGGGLVIVPAFGEDETGASTLLGGFSVTHASSGRMVTTKQACLMCARLTAQQLTESGVDWAALEFTSQEETKAAVGELLGAVNAAMTVFRNCTHVRS